MANNITAQIEELLTLGVLTASDINRQAVQLAYGIISRTATGWECNNRTCNSIHEAVRAARPAQAARTTRSSEAAQARIAGASHGVRGEIWD